MKNALLHDSFENQNGILHFGGINTVKLAEEFGTPLFVYHQERIEQNIERLREAFASRYGEFLIFYAIKANNNPWILDLIAQKIDGADASRDTEIKLAEQSQFPMISYSGNFASATSLKTGFGNADIVNLDSTESLPRLLENGIPERLTFRINPGFGQGSFANNIFAGHEAKFGIRHEDAVQAYKEAKKAGVKHFGMYMMTGSCVLDPSYFEAITEKLLDIAGEIRKKVGIQLEWFNLGGGFGIPYHHGEPTLDMNEVAEKVTAMVKRKTQEHDLGHPTLMIEPGRYIVGDAGILLTTVEEVKNKSYKPYVGVDAGMNTLLRAVLYETAYHEVVMANRMNDRDGKRRTIVGGICENTDKIAKDRKMPTPRRGDRFAFLCTGAYGFPMSLQFNTVPRAAEVLVHNGKATLIRRRETLKDIMHNVPPRKNGGTNI